MSFLFELCIVKGTKLSESKRLTIYVLLHPKSSPSKQILQNFNLWDFQESAYWGCFLAEMPFLDDIWLFGGVVSRLVPAKTSSPTILT